MFQPNDSVVFFFFNQINNNPSDQVSCNCFVFFPMMSSFKTVKAFLCPLLALGRRRARYPDVSEIHRHSFTYSVTLSGYIQCTRAAGYFLRFGGIISDGAFYPFE